MEKDEKICAPYMDREESLIRSHMSEMMAGGIRGYIERISQCRGTIKEFIWVLKEETFMPQENILDITLETIEHYDLRGRIEEPGESILCFWLNDFGRCIKIKLYLGSDDYMKYDGNFKYLDFRLRRVDFEEIKYE